VPRARRRLTVLLRPSGGHLRYALRLVAGLAAAALVAAGCQAPPPLERVRSDDGARVGPTPREPATSDGGALRYGIREPSSIVPGDAVEPDELVVVSALFESLTAYDDDLQPSPAAAEAWEPDETASVWTFRLREGATFHDGSPVTAADFAFAWNRAAREGRGGYHLEPVEGYPDVAAGEADSLAGVVVLDERTLQVRLRHPLADFPAVAAHPTLGPLPRRPWEDDPEGFRLQPVGNGPFKAAEAWARGRFIRLARFDGWREGPVPLSEVLFRIMDPDTAYLAFQQGRLDYAALPPGAVERAVEEYGVSVDGYRGPGALLGEIPVLYYFGFSLVDGAYADAEVRKAISQLIDREAIAADNLEGNLSPAVTLVPPPIPGRSERRCRACRSAPERARAVLEEREFDQLTLWFNRGGGHERIAAELREALADIGVRLVFRTEEFPAYLEVLQAGDARFYRFGWAPDYPTLDAALYPLFHSSSVPEAGGHNYGRYADPDVDRLLDEARATLDPLERAARYREVEAIVLDRDQVIVPVVSYRLRSVVSDRVVGLRLSPMGVPNLAEVRVQPADP
jgi:oligopeptide transport system substrate-binding protein